MAARAFAAVVVFWVMAGIGLTGQTSGKNPLEGNPDAILAGMGGYRVRCADCHGLDGRGSRGPAITQVWNSGRTDEGLFKTIRTGVPGSGMPAFASPRTSDRDLWQILAYLKTLAEPPAPKRPRGIAGGGAPWRLSDGYVGDLLPTLRGFGPSVRQR